MKYNMITKTGLFQEGMGLSSSSPRQRLLYDEPLGLSSKIKKNLASMKKAKEEFFAQEAIDEAPPVRPASGSGTGPKEKFFKTIQGYSLDPGAFHKERRGMFFYTISEGQRVLVTDKHGHCTLIEGPKRVFRWGKRFQVLGHHIAYPGEFLIVKYRDGSQLHHPGPQEEWLDPRVHSQIEKADALQIAGKEAVVVYTRDTEGKLARRIVMGPELFVPSPGEWLHTFTWHGSKEGDYKKVPGGLVFQKLWLMPDQMYHDVENVRTLDDVVLTLQFMIFFELVDVSKMLDASHDPIGDIINATSSDVIDLVARDTFEDYKKHSDRLNELKSYPQLLNRAEQIGYHIHKIVYRGYTTAQSLKAMQEQSIEARTRLKLETETEEQSQRLADFKQNCELERVSRRREQEKLQEVHEIEKEKMRHQQELQMHQEKCEGEYTIRQRSLEQEIRFLEQLRQMGVDLTQYLTRGRADQIIELRGEKSSPHVHLNPEKRKES